MKNHPRYFVSTLALFVLLALALAAAPIVPVAAQDAATTYRRLPVAVYREKMRAGWLGQMVGVSFGAPTEFRYVGRMIPAAEVPALRPGIANDAFNQDDLYVEMTFLKSLESYGLGVSAAQAGIDFANSEYQLWHANLAARSNLRMGIAPPDSGHPAFSGFTDDIDYQIEADFAGLISPGLLNNAISLGGKFGSIMNYGDGLYGGQFISCMYAEAFFESDPLKLIETGLSCIPAQSQYAEAIRDVVAWWRENPDDWQATWTRIDAKYRQNPAYRRYSSGDDWVTDPAFDIDAKINGAFVVLGLLYGQGDPVTTMTVAMRAGQDSDCNPSSAAGVLFAALSPDADLDASYAAGLDTRQQFSYTDYNFEQLLDVSEALARQSVLAAGGSLETDAAGGEVFVIPVQAPQPSPFVQSWAPEPPVGSLYTPAETAQITAYVPSLRDGLRALAPDWVVAECADNSLLGLKASLQGRTSVFVTSPVSSSEPCRLTRVLDLTGKTSAQLRLDIGHFPGGGWDLVVRANDQELVRQTIDNASAPDVWTEVAVDLSAFAGQHIQLDLLQQSNGSRFEAGYWDAIELTAS